MTTPDRTQSSADCQSAPAAAGRIGNPQAIDIQDESTGLPGFRTWRGVYWFVLGCFVLYVVLLTVFTRTFS